MEQMMHRQAVSIAGDEYEIVYRPGLTAAWVQTVHGALRRDIAAVRMLDTQVPVLTPFPGCRLDDIDAGALMSTAVAIFRKYGAGR